MISSKTLSDSPLTAIKEQLRASLDNRKNETSICLHLDHPFNLYLIEEQAKLYLDAIEDDLFSRQLYKPFLLALDKNINRIFSGVQGNVDFIDLGPGYPDKTAPLVKHLLTLGVNIRYIPVDISRYFLDATVSYFATWGIEIIPLNILFEEAPLELQKAGLNNHDSMRIINIGFTFNNFSPDSILRLLQKLVTKKSVVIIATQIIDDRRIEESIEPYRSMKADKFNFKMLELIGLNRAAFDYVVRIHNGRIEMGYAANEDIYLDGVGNIKKHDILITSFSYRYRENQLTDYLERYFSNIDVIKDNKGLSK